MRCETSLVLLKRVMDLRFAFTPPTMVIPHTPKTRKAFLDKVKERRFRVKSKDGTKGPWMQRKIECKVGNVDSHVFGFALRHSPNKILYHPDHPAHGSTKRFFYQLQNLTVQKAKLSAKLQQKKQQHHAKNKKKAALKKVSK